MWKPLQTALNHERLKDRRLKDPMNNYTIAWLLGKIFTIEGVRRKGCRTDHISLAANSARLNKLTASKMYIS
jgi:hypothetical protein